MKRWAFAITLCLATTLGAQAPAPSSSTPAAESSAKTIAEARARALLKSGNVHEEAGRLDQAEHDYVAASRAAEQAGNREILGESHLMLGYLQYYRGEMNAALVSLLRAHALAVALKDENGQRIALSYIAHTYADAKVGQYDRAIEYYKQLLPQYEKGGKQDRVSDTLYDIGSTFERKGDPAAALEWYRQALAAEEKLGRLGEVAYVKRSIGVALGKLGRAGEAVPWFDQALRYFESQNEVDRVMQVRQSRGIVYRKLGRIDDAIADLEAAERWFTQQKNTRYLEKNEEELALAYAAARRWREAYETRTRHAALQRDLADKLREEHTSRLRVQFDVEKKEVENRALLRDKAADERIRRLQTIILILSAAVIAALIFLAIRSIRSAQKMRAMAMTDELTRLPNRRHILAVAADQRERSRSTQEPLSLIALDIDHFKRVNDTWGHAAGDTILQRVAHACRTSLRPDDRIGRTGGEEFIVILPSTNARDAIAVAERLRAAVEQIDNSDVDPTLHTTISLGVTQWCNDEPLTRLTTRADEFLYRAKESGRNRVMAATPA